ncbi:hypothetical protein F383_32233 [Gossypium arboreum]|uniref:Uncharacterized protein n=1 Tax=Gossypium arboreum TaxID=29729 RepID=A0A0B0MWG8_GOSAR|nr:hypothetical protein F383_32233 [Gossypium arboreum]
MDYTNTLCIIVLMWFLHAKQNRNKYWLTGSLMFKLILSDIIQTN